jgi:hypothetical protein
VEQVDGFDAECVGEDQGPIEAGTIAAILDQTAGQHII